MQRMNPYNVQNLKASFSQSTFVLITIIGALLSANGLFHVAIYLLDAEPVFSGLRAINSASLCLGNVLLAIGLSKLKWD